MKHSLIALSFVAAAAVLPTASYADLAYNVGAVSDYRYRGISQTRLKPALQGGIDFTSGGLYLGTWASTIKWIDDSKGDAKVEVDLYAGYKGEIVKDVAYDVGILNYWYPSAVTSGWSATPYTNPNTTELYGAVTFGPVTAKYSHGLTSLFGNVDSKNSYYAEVSATFDVSGVSVVPHVGYQKVKNTANASYTDYSITVSKDFNGIVPSLALVGTDADKGFYVPGANANSTKFLGKAALVLGVKYNF